ncbi:MAG: SEL1-like repeat protein [Promethearchaeia archaeon]
MVSGVCYHEGKGVDKDDEKAVELWTKSAKQDNQVPRAYATQIMWSFGIFARVLRLTTERGSATRSDDQSV